MLLSLLIFVSSTVLFFYYLSETLRHLRRHRKTMDLQSGPPSPGSGFDAINKSLLLLLLPKYRTPASVPAI